MLMRVVSECLIFQLGMGRIFNVKIAPIVATVMARSAR